VVSARGCAAAGWSGWRCGLRFRHSTIPARPCPSPTS
jgi:hypothetical protein